MALLQLRDLNKHFGGLHVTNSVNLVLEQGEIHCLIGPNGAGKTTLFAMIAGFLQPDGGSVSYEGRDITALAPHVRARGHRAHLPDRAAVRRPERAGEHRGWRLSAHA